MANDNTSLRLVFSYVGSDDTFSMSISNADATTPAATVKALMQNIITNQSIFNVMIDGIVGAEFITRSVEPVAVTV